nr:hypothetical protein CPBEC2_25090 [Clostridium perfringens]BDA31863.1 hypothetical protein CPBEC4_19630 [Clostridium perfringens]BDA34421.1 hypothetical protein CPBEC5_14290 [Clostridium perfringens]
MQIAAAMIVVRIIFGGFFNPPKKIKNIVHIHKFIKEDRRCQSVDVKIKLAKIQIKEILWED